MAEDFLRRWSRLKHESERAAEPPADGKPEVPAPAPAPAEPLPPVEALTPDADFRPFMQPKVDGLLRRAALKKLFGDPHFNIPDPFEPFSGDWTGEALPPEMLATLNQAKILLFDKQEETKPEHAQAEAKVEETAEEKVEEKAEEKKPDELRRQDA
jgi:hypothetical protein